MANSSSNSKIIQPHSLNEPLLFAFRPWVRKAGLSILVVAAVLTLIVLSLAAVSSDARYGWAAEPFVAFYLAVLWVGGGKVYFATFRPIVELLEWGLVLRPVHVFGPRRIAWSSILGTEQMVRGDRLVIYFRAPQGTRFLALNLNLVRGRREFLQALEERLQMLGFAEKILGASRYHSKS